MRGDRSPAGYVESAVVWHPVRNSARPLLRAIWIYSRGYAERATCDGRLPEGLKLRNWVPVIQAVRGRRRLGKTVFGPDERWLREHGVVPTLQERVLTLPILYVVVP